jgi:rod shape-determining protein MreC
MLSRRTRILLAVLVVASLTFVILDLRGGQGPFGSVRTAASNVLGGLERAAATVFSPITGAGSWWSDMRDQAAQIDALETENGRLRSELDTLTNDRARADALDALLRVSSVGGYRFVPAEVISVGPAQDFSWTITIDAGRNDGIEADMSVINGDGLVGRVVKTTASTSTVVLIVDVTSAVGGRVATTEEIGIVAGTGRQDSLEFQLLDPMADVRVGDALVTFGSKGGRPYAPGLPIGEVVDVSGTPGQLTRVASVRPFVDVSQLSIVGVVTKPPREDPRDSVLPRNASVPTTAPSPAPLGGVDTETTAPNEETAATRKEANASPEASAVPEQETPASLQPQDPGAADGNG